MSVGPISNQYFALNSFHHIPKENFWGVASCIEEKFDPKIEVICDFRPHLLHIYLDPEIKKSRRNSILRNLLRAIKFTWIVRSSKT